MAGMVRQDLIADSKKQNGMAGMVRQDLIADRKKQNGMAGRKRQIGKGRIE